MAYRLASPNIQFLDAQGNPLAGGFLYFYATGTNTPVNTYSDNGLTTPNTNPIILDSGGYAGSIFLAPTQQYKVVLTDKNNVQQWTEDPVSDPSAQGETVTTSLAISDAAGATKSLFLQTSGINRWGLISDSEPETGSNAGSNFVLNSYTDDGSVISSVLTINRADGVLDFSSMPTVDGTSISQIALPTGSIIMVMANVAPSGFYELDGSLKNRVTDARLWAYAQASGNIAANDAAWTAGQFSPGDGSTTFRIPKTQGYFLRAWDHGAGIDPGRAIGTTQTHQLQDHEHNVSVNANPNTTYRNQANGGAPSADASSSQYTTSNPVTGNHGSETRPSNLVAMFCIKT